MSWFPRPASPDAIAPSRGAGPFNRDRLFDLLVNPDGEEWRHKVGVSSPQDGSAKATTRLLCSGNWVFKTDLAQCFADCQQALAEREKLEQRLRAWDLWHPSKFWFTLTLEAGWLNISGCPRLIGLRQASTPAEKISLWTEMIRFALEADQRYQVGLDISPSNFAQADATGPLFYLDDETYPPLTSADLVEAIAGRLLEEQGSPASFFADWGHHLKPVFQEYQDKFDLTTFTRNLSEHPVFNRLHQEKEALLNTLAQSGSVPGLRTQPALPQRGKVCVLGDIHANLPALEAVLTDAAKQGAEAFLFLGDAVGYGPHPEPCIAKLQALPSAVMVRGNHDHIVGSGAVDQDTNRHARWTHAWSIERLPPSQRQWLLSLPLDWEVDGVLAVHGSPIDPHRFHAYVYELTYKENLEYMMKEGHNLCFYGNTHVPFIHQRDDQGQIHKIRPEPDKTYPISGTQLVNPGAVGQPRDGDNRAAYLIWDRGQNQIRFHRVPYNMAQTLGDLELKEFPDALKMRLDWGR